MADPLELLVEQVVSAHRPLTAAGELRGHPAWHDLPEGERVRAYEETARARALEAALDARGLSTTAKAVLARIQAAGGGGEAPEREGTPGPGA
jgi:hypothetical protein